MSIITGIQVLICFFFNEDNDIIAIILQAIKK